MIMMRSEKESKSKMEVLSFHKRNHSVIDAYKLLGIDSFLYADRKYMSILNLCAYTHVSLFYCE